MARVGSKGISDRYNKDYSFEQKRLDAINVEDIPKMTEDLIDELVYLETSPKTQVEGASNTRLMALQFLETANSQLAISNDGIQDEYNIEIAKKSYLRYLKLV